MTHRLRASFAAAILLATARLAHAQPTPPAKPGPAPLYKDPATGMALVFVKGGCFRMGDLYTAGHATGDEGEEGEVPVHEVCLSDFYIGKFEVTQGEWKAIMGAGWSRESGCNGLNMCHADDCPMGNAGWSDIQEFIGKLNAKDGATRYRLPTEAEWEYAARSGGRYERYSGGNDLDSVSWYGGNSGAVTHPVGRKAPNGLGIHDMSGNAWEVTNDWYSATYYAVSPRDNPTGPPSGEGHAKRGGCVTGSPTNSRTSRRSVNYGHPCDLEGFRLVRIP